MISDKRVVEHALNQCSTVYKQIKKNEVSPQTDYLFAGLHDPNAAQKSLHKLDMVYSVLDGGGPVDPVLIDQSEIDISTIE